MNCHPHEWVGLGFTANIDSGGGYEFSRMDGIEAVAVQIAWGMTPHHPAPIAAYISDLRKHMLVPVGWGWCAATDPGSAYNEGQAHAYIVRDFGLDHFVANMEENYDAHGNSGLVQYYMPADYCRGFRQIAPDVEFAVTTTPLWAPDQNALREAGAVIMPQAFTPENKKGVTECVEHCRAWGWSNDRIRPLAQVYETSGQLPDAQPFLEESEACAVGLVPYVLETAVAGPGRALLDALAPAIKREPTALTPIPPTNGDEIMQLIGTSHGIEATYNRLKTLDPKGCNPAFDPKNPNALPLDQLKAYDKWCRTMLILVWDHDEVASTFDV